MSDDGELGLVGAASIGLCGMSGGGVFAVLGLELGYFESDRLRAGDSAVEDLRRSFSCPVVTYQFGGCGATTGGC